MTQTVSTEQSVVRTLDEQILVVKRTDLFPEQAFHGFKPVDIQEILTVVQEKRQFLPRSLMEVDPTYKQIIPYLIYTYDNRYFLMQRHAQASESRLRSKFSLGIGGHIRQEDMNTDSLFDWARREFHEEVSYNGSLHITPLGLLNDDSSEVGRVHIGFVLLVTGDTDQIAVKSELHSGALLALDEVAVYRDRMESWSQMVFDFLVG